MKIDGKITILIDQEKTTIEIADENANTTFVRVELTPEQLSSALSRLSNTDCSVEVYVLERVGKKHKVKEFIFEIPEDIKKDKLSEFSQIMVDKEMPGEGWVSDGYFGSQNSFFNKDGKKYARCYIRRWI